MKKIILTIICVVLPLIAGAQGIKFAYFSYDEVMKSTPDYSLAQRNLADLKTKYDAEMKRVEDEFNKKYEDFLDGQRSFAPSILKKRQSELQELIEKNMAFKQEAQRLMAQAEADALAPLKARLNQAVAKVGEQRGLAFILNTDNNAAPYLNPALGENVSAAISAELK